MEEGTAVELEGETVSKRPRWTSLLALVFGEDRPAEDDE